jgi:hypothetical protein
MSDDSSEDKAKKSLPPSSTPSPSDPSVTTTWTHSPPPVIIEDEEETVVSAMPARPEPLPEDFETLVAPLPVKASPSTAIAPSASLRPMLLERIEPSLGRGERLRLDAAQWQVSLGRAQESDIHLYTASASRVHASIAGNESGEWVLTPETGKTVLIDGEGVAQPVVLEAGMNIVLGQDHLRCVDEGLERRRNATGSASASSRASAEGGQGRIVIAGILLGAVTLIGLVWAFIALRGD